MLTFDELSLALLNQNSAIFERAILFADNIALFIPDNCQAFAMKILILENREVIIADIIELFKIVYDNLDFDGKIKLINIFLEISKTCAKTVLTLIPTNDNSIQIISLQKRCQDLVKIAEAPANSYTKSDLEKQFSFLSYCTNLKDIIEIYTNYCKRTSQAQNEQKSPPLQASQYHPQIKRISEALPSLSPDIRPDRSKPSTRGISSTLRQSSFVSKKSSKGIRAPQKTDISIPYYYELNSTSIIDEPGFMITNGIAPYRFLMGNLGLAQQFSDSNTSIYATDFVIVTPEQIDTLLTLEPRKAFSTDITFSFVIVSPQPNIWNIQIYDKSILSPHILELDDKDNVVRFEHIKKFDDIPITSASGIKTYNVVVTPGHKLLLLSFNIDAIDDASLERFKLEYFHNISVDKIAESLVNHSKKEHSAFAFAVQLSGSQSYFLPVIRKKIALSTNILPQKRVNDILQIYLNDLYQDFTKTNAADFDSNRIPVSSLAENTMTSDVFSQTMLSSALPVDVRASFFIELLYTLTQANLINFCEDIWMLLLKHVNKQECIDDIIALLNNIVFQISSEKNSDYQKLMYDDFGSKLRVFARIIAGKILTDIKDESNSTDILRSSCKILQLSQPLENDYYSNPDRVINKLQEILQMHFGISIELKSITRSKSSDDVSVHSSGDNTRSSSSLKRSLYNETPDDSQDNRSSYLDANIAHLMGNSRHASTFPSTFLQYQSKRKPEQTIPGFNAISALADGNCGFNAITIFLVKKIANKELPLENHQEFYKIACNGFGIEISEHSLKIFLQDKTDREKQQILSPILRLMSVNKINESYSEYKELFEQQLSGCFDAFFTETTKIFDFTQNSPLFRQIFDIVFENPMDFCATLSDLDNTYRNKILKVFIQLKNQLTLTNESADFYTNNFEEFLNYLADFLRTIQDYPFLIHEEIRSKFAELFILQSSEKSDLKKQLIAWWNNEYKDLFFNKFSSSAELTMQESSWADNYLLDALAHQLKITIVLHNINQGNIENRQTQYVFGIGGGLLEISDDNKSQLEVLKQYGFGDYVHGYFQLKLFASESEFNSALDKIPYQQTELSEITLALVDYLIEIAHQTGKKQTQIPIVFPHDLPHYNYFSIDKLLELGIIQKEGTGYRFISDDINYTTPNNTKIKLVVPDRERIKQKLSGIDDLTRALIISIYEDFKDVPVCHILRRINHFDYLESESINPASEADNPYRITFAAPETSPSSSPGLREKYGDFQNLLDSLEELRLSDEDEQLSPLPPQRPSNPAPIEDDSEFDDVDAELFRKNRTGPT